MKICFIAHAESLHSRLWAQFMVDRGHDVHFITTMPHEVPGVKLYDIPLKGKSSLFYFLAIPEVKRLVWDIKPDILHGYVIISNGLLAAYSRYRPLVLTNSGGDVLLDPQSSRLRRILVKTILKHADMVTSVGHHMEKNMLELGVPKEKLRTIVRGIRPEQFPFVDHSGDLNSPTILYSKGFHKRYCNYGLLIKAIPKVMKEIPGAKFVMAGTGQDAPDAWKIARKLGIGPELEFTGWIPHDEMVQITRKATVHANTTICDGTSVSLMEAMSSGLFPVVPAVRANRDWIEDGVNGLLVPLDDPDAMADAIIKAVSDPERYRNATAYNRKLVVEKANFNRNMLEFDKVYEEVLEKYRKGVR